MSFLAVKGAKGVCEHRGILSPSPSQDWVTVEGAPVLVKGDLDGLAVSFCMGGAAVVGILRCRTVRTIEDDRSHSAFVSIGGRPVVLSTARGATDWSEVSVAGWRMTDAAQDWIEIGGG